LVLFFLSRATAQSVRMRNPPRANRSVSSPINQRADIFVRRFEP